MSEKSISVGMTIDGDNNVRREQSTKSSQREIMSNNGALNPSSPLPGRGKRPLAVQAEAEAEPERVEASPVQKKPRRDDSSNKEDAYVNVMLPNGSSFMCTLRRPSIKSIIDLHKGIETLGIQKIENDKKNGKNDESTSVASARAIKWGPQIYLEDCSGKRCTYESWLVAAPKAKKSDPLRLLLYDGEPGVIHKNESMHNITPKAEMLGHLPQGYTMQTALADHVDNALQAVWHNDPEDRRLVSVTVTPTSITIFDTGQGMDLTPERHIANWGTVGGSTHRAMHHEAVGLEPPFLKPYLGKYGAGGVAAALHLGKSVTVWSKTKESQKVSSLVLDQKELLERQNPQNRQWKIAGSLRNMTIRERKLSRHGSFTKVEITQLKSQYGASGDNQGLFTEEQIRQLLKDVYYPYIQTETASSSKTVCHVRFLVNNCDLLEVTECETAILKMATCNGDPFVVDIHMRRYTDEWDNEKKARQEEVANARITCHYYPNLQGREALETAIDQLKILKSKATIMTFDSFPRISIRWLGRLLPEVPWRTLPFMEVPPTRSKQRVDVQQHWTRRVCAFLDTDAGFHPNQSKTELERDQPFVRALEHIGTEDLSGTSAHKVQVKIRHKGKELSPAQLTSTFRDWVKEMHSSFDEEFTFLDQATYLLDHPHVEEELGVVNKLVIFHKHMKDGKNEFKVDDRTPLWVKLPKGKGLRFDTYATVEYFYHDGPEDEPGDVKFLYRPLGEENGCKFVQKGGMCHFERNNSKWLHATKLTMASRLDETTWKQKLKEISNKSPSHVEVLREEDLDKLELGEAFPTDRSQHHAGLSLPKKLYVVVRPKKGSGASSKQGMIVSYPIKLVMSVSHCSCLTASCCKRKSGRFLGKCHSDDEHARVVISELSALDVREGGIKGIYMFYLESSKVKKLVEKGRYVFHISVEEEQYDGVVPAVSTVVILPSKATATWTLCNHTEDCTFEEHENSQPSALTIRLNEPLKQNVFLQKYDEYKNSQEFEDPLELEAAVESPKGEELGIECKVRADFAESTRRHRLLVKNVLFRNGSLQPVEQTYEGVFRVRCPGPHKAEMSCRVLPGEVSSVQVTESWPVISPDLCFQEALQPGEVITRLTLQGLDKSGNKIDRSQKLRLQLTGLELQDQNTEAREVDQLGCITLGGLLKVSCHYNSKGCLSITSGKGLKLCEIRFKTVVRQLIASKVPGKAYVGAELEGVCVEIVDENGHVDAELDGYTHSLSVDWLPGVTYPLTRGNCVLPPFKLPPKPGPWKGHVYFSANRLLHTTLMVDLELAPARSLAPAEKKSHILTAQCGICFLVPFLVLDEQQQRTVFTDGMQQQIKAMAEALDSGDHSRSVYKPCTVELKTIKLIRVHGLPSYEASIVVSGSVGRYKITLVDTVFQLKGQIDAVCNLLHGHIASLSPTRSDRTLVTRFPKPLTNLEVPRCSPVSLTVFLFDSEQNLCTSCDDRFLLMKVPDCSHWEPLEARVKKGVGKFVSPPLVLPVNSYRAVIELDGAAETWYSIDGPLEPQKVDLTLQIVDGNYPASLKLRNSGAIRKSLTGDPEEYLQPITVFVKSADGKRLQDRPTVGVRLQAATRTEVKDTKEYLGTFVDTQEDDASFSFKEDIRYDFVDICTPSQAGTYEMEFFVRDSEVQPQSQLLYVKHGPPTRVEIVRSEAGQEMDAVMVRLADAHGNTCEDCPDVEVKLSLFPNVIPPRPPCSILSNSRTRVVRGNGDFGLLRLSEGEQGKYSLRISLHDDSFPIAPAERKILITRGNVDNNIRNQIYLIQCKEKEQEEYLNSITEIERKRRELVAQERRLKKDIACIQGEKRDLEYQRDTLRDEQEQNQDEETLQELQGQSFRSPGDVIRDVKRMRPHSAATTLLEAQSEKNFLSSRSSDPAAQDVLGLVVLLACVESYALNKALSDKLGRDLLMMVCQTQEGVDSLERRDRYNKVIKNRGLHHFARDRGYTISGKSSYLALEDLRYTISVPMRYPPFHPAFLNNLKYYRRKDGRPHVDLSHPQQLLNIDPPVLRNGQVPRGFLGFAVNLVHLSPDRLQLRVRSRWDGEGGLRESLFFHLLGFLPVYDTWNNLKAAKDGSRHFFGSGLSLDGGSLRNCRQEFGEERSEARPLYFGSIQPDEIMAGSLLLSTRSALERAQAFDSINREIANRERSLDELHSKVAEKIAHIENIRLNLVVVRDEQIPLQKEVQTCKKDMEELEKAQAAISDRRKRNDIAAGSRSTDKETMRAFMIDA